MNYYQTKKSETRDFAIQWQLHFHAHNYSYGELAYFTDMFERLGKRYGLLKEFKENGILWQRKNYVVER